MEHDDLADDELRTKLVQHGCPRQLADALVTNRDTDAARRQIAQILDT